MQNRLTKISLNLSSFAIMLSCLLIICNFQLEECCITEEH